MSTSCQCNRGAVFTLLGLPADASPSELRAAYLNRMRVLHPDRHRQASPAVQEEASRMTAQLAAAWTAHQAGVAAGPCTRRQAPVAAPPPDVTLRRRPVDMWL